MKLFVGNLPNDMSEAELTLEFKVFGEVQSLKIVYNHETGTSRGFAFVEMSDNAARKAIEGLNQTDIRGRTLNVNEAQDRRSNTRRNF